MGLATTALIARDKGARFPGRESMHRAAVEGQAAGAYAPAHKYKSGWGSMKKMMAAALALAPALILAAQTFEVRAQNAAAQPADGVPTARELAPKMPAPVAPFEWAYPVSP